MDCIILMHCMHHLLQLSSLSTFVVSCTASNWLLHCVISHTVSVCVPSHALCAPSHALYVPSQALCVPSHALCIMPSLARVYHALPHVCSSAVCVYLLHWICSSLWRAKVLRAPNKQHVHRSIPSKQALKWLIFTVFFFLFFFSNSTHFQISFRPGHQGMLPPICDQ